MSTVPYRQELYIHDIYKFLQLCHSLALLQIFLPWTLIGPQTPLVINWFVKIVILVIGCQQG